MFQQVGKSSSVKPDVDVAELSKQRRKNLISLHVYCIKNDSQFGNYNSLQHFGTVPWSTSRLIWIGFHKNNQNTKCIFGQLDKNIIKYILQFFSMHSDSSIVKFDKKTTFKQIAQQYSNKAKIKYEDVQLGNDPLVHIWCQFGGIKNIYLQEMSAVRIRESSFDGIDRKKWVELPQDYMDKQLNDIELNLNKYPRICIEYLRIGVNKNVKGYKIISSSGESSTVYWPLAKPNYQWRDFQVGDIIDVNYTVCACTSIFLCYT